MSIPLLATKLYIPPLRPNVVARPRLVERLHEGRQRRLTLISAPAGFGKTTLVSEWIASLSAEPYQTDQTHSFNLAWLSLDEADNDPTRFLTYLVAALQTIVPAAGTGVLEMLLSPQPPPSEAILTTLLNNITSFPGHVAIVLDDYHVIDAKAVGIALTFLLEHLPPQLHLIITTREDPQLPLARLRARGQLTELRAADLRFTPAEAAGFLNQVMELNLAVEHVSALETRTEGWVAGLQLAALSMRGRTDVAQFVKAFAGNNRYILDYLVEEVLQRQPAHVRSFLLQTSILDRLSGPLCDAVTGQHDGMAQLEALERGNLFVVPLDDTRHWFRYHRLFADVLAAHMLHEQPARIPTLHQQASAWYASNGLTAEAIRHALAAHDFARAAGLVELAWPAMDGRFQAAAWLAWARALPDTLVRARPVLGVAYAWALLNGGELEAAEARLQAAEHWLGPAPEHSEHPEAQPAEMTIVDEAQFQALPASIATARAYLSQARGDMPGSVTYGRQALTLLPAEDYLRRGPAAALLGLAEWASGDLEAAYRTLADAMAGFQKAGNLHFAISITYGLADIRRVQGRLYDAIRCYTQALQLALDQGEPLIRGTADLYLGLSELHREQADLEAATWHLLRSEELGEQAALPDWRYRLCRTQARFTEAQGDLAGALDLLDQAERHYYRTPLPDVRPLAALRARVWVAQGRLHEARRWAQAHGVSVDGELSFLREFEHITLARVLLAEYTRAPAGGAIHQAMRLLDRLQQAAAAGRMGSAIEIGVLQALAHQAQGASAAALATLERALKLAEPQGYVRIFVDEGPAMARLLSAAAAQGIMPGYIGKLLAAFASVAAEAPPRTHHIDLPAAAPTQPLIEPLSTRELEVLQLMAQGLSNSEISTQLFLALSTVKGHNRKIFGKLQVQRRTEAIARARALGLL
ncbi:MAG: helix-turn-helix transcriptional regulator [Kouleothrix sp.]|jgi:LuxR family maltose regulon positive regulatory protein|nr:helix-turn-helix transcriptional regulator [Kouleothrix sp.]